MEDKNEELKNQQTPEGSEPAAKTAPAEEAAEAAAAEATVEPAQEPEIIPSEAEQLRSELEEQKAAYLRLAAEYDNFRKRTQKEKDRIYADAQADTTEKFLGIFDNLERAVAQETADEAYKKGVVMIQSSYMDVLKKLGVEQFGQEGETFDPNFHNAVMHEENPELGESVLSGVFQKGFKLGDRVIRPAMVKVAN